MPEYLDRPIVEIEHDRLGYAPFAHSLAQGIQGRGNIEEGYVIGLEGKWGMGKTSALNLVVKFIEDDQKNTDPQEKIVVVRIAIWPTSGADVLAKSYIQQLGAALSANFSARVGRKYMRSIARFAEKATGAVEAGSTGVAVLAGGAFPAAGLLGKIFGALTSLFAAIWGSESLQGATVSLRTDLLKIGGQLLVIVDDIDRLHPDEMRQLLTLVKTFGDLPRVTHLLLYDREIVDDALAASLNSSRRGPAYLDKIVQLSTTLPTVPHWRLQDFLRDRLKSAGIQFDELRLSDMWRKGLRDLLVTPREVNRLVNSLVVSWPAISDHADFIDFLSLESIRLAEKGVWDSIRNSRYELVGRSDRAHIGNINIASLVTAGDGENAWALQSLIGDLFPIAVSNGGYVDRVDLRNRRSIGAPECVDVYFLLRPGQMVSAADIDQFLIATADPDQLRAMLLSLEKDRTRLRFVLNGLTDAIYEGAAGLDSLFNVLMDIGDDLLGVLSSDPPAAYDEDVLVDLDALFWKILGWISPESREALVTSSIQSASSMAVPAILWQRIALRAHLLPNINYSGAMEFLLSDAAAVGRVGKVVASRLRHAFDQEDYRFYQAPLLGWILNIWSQAGDESNAERAARSLIGRDVSLVLILDSLMDIAHSNGRIERDLKRSPMVPGVATRRLVRIAQEKLATESFLSEISAEDRRLVYRNIVKAFVSLFAALPEDFLKGEREPWEEFEIKAAGSA